MSKYALPGNESAQIRTELCSIFWDHPIYLADRDYIRSLKKRY